MEGETPQKHRVAAVTFRRMLKATVHDGAQQLRLQQEVPETGAVDGHIGPLNLLLPGWSGILRGGLLLFVVVVIQQLVINVILGHAVLRERHSQAHKFNYHSTYIHTYN